MGDTQNNAFMQLGEIAYKKIRSQIKMATEEEAIRTAYDCMPARFLDDDEKAKLFLDGFVDGWHEATQEITIDDIP